MEAAGEKLDLTQMKMHPSVVPRRDVSSETMDAAMTRLNDLTERDRTPKKKPWRMFW
jgi:hypothetical protein